METLSLIFKECLVNLRPAIQQEYKDPEFFEKNMGNVERDQDGTYLYFEEINAGSFYKVRVSRWKSTGNGMFRKIEYGTLNAREIFSWRAMKSLSPRI